MESIAPQWYLVIPNQYCTRPNTPHNNPPAHAEETLGGCPLYDWNGSDCTAECNELSNIFAKYQQYYIAEMAFCAAFLK